MIEEKLKDVRKGELILCIRSDFPSSQVMPHWLGIYDGFDSRRRIYFERMRIGFCSGRIKIHGEEFMTVSRIQCSSLDFSNIRDVIIGKENILSYMKEEPSLQRYATWIDSLEKPYNLVVKTFHGV